MDDTAETWSTFDIRSDGDPNLACPVRVFWSTNDDNDDGYPDEDIVSCEFSFSTVDAARKFTGVTRRGYYGQPVTVTLDGQEI